MIQSNSINSEECQRILKDALKALWFMSKKSYLHLDIKPDNLMQGENWVLVDFGMAKKFSPENEITENKRQAGNGTPWYMGRDAHRGRMNRRVDLESLIYTLVEAESGSLPWFGEIRHDKKSYLNNILEAKRQFFSDFKDLKLPEYLNHLINYVDNFEPGTEPDYLNLIKIDN